MAKSIYTRDERKEQFVKSGIKLARKVGVSKVTGAAVAAEHNITAPLVFHIFGTREKLHEAIRAAATAQGIKLDDVKPVALHRSAKTGKIVTAAHAKANPDTTVRERVRR